VGEDIAVVLWWTVTANCSDGVCATCYVVERAERGRLSYLLVRVSDRYEWRKMGKTLD
jgi:hypothetical protein